MRRVKKIDGAERVGWARRRCHVEHWTSLADYSPYLFPMHTYLSIILQQCFRPDDGGESMVKGGTDQHAYNYDRAT